MATLKELCTFLQFPQHRDLVNTVSLVLTTNRSTRQWENGLRAGDHGNRGFYSVALWIGIIVSPDTLTVSLKGISSSGRFFAILQPRLFFYLLFTEPHPNRVCSKMKSKNLLYGDTTFLF